LAPEFDWSINISLVLSVVFVGGGFFFLTKSDMRRFRTDVADIKTDLKVLNKIVIDSAVSSSRLDTQAQEIAMLRQTIYDMQRGRGFIANGEYPRTVPVPEGKT
jgi:hypothetical protein